MSKETKKIKPLIKSDDLIDEVLEKELEKPYKRPEETKPQGKRKRKV